MLCSGVLLPYLATLLIALLSVDNVWGVGHWGVAQAVGLLTVLFLQEDKELLLIRLGNQTYYNYYYLKFMLDCTQKLSAFILELKFFLYWHRIEWRQVLSRKKKNKPNKISKFSFANYLQNGPLSQRWSNFSSTISTADSGSPWGLMIFLGWLHSW